jgi:hydrogenase expression/formation protein HypC
MCLSIPGKVVWVKDNRAEVDFGEVRTVAATHLIEDLVPGDYVLVHSGYILQKIDVEEAKITLELFDEIARLQAQSPGPGLQ